MEMNGCDVKNVDANVLARCFNSLEKVENVKLSSSQAEAVFTGILEDTKLKHLNISDSHLEAIPDKTFAQVVDKLETLKLIFCRLTRQQVRAVLGNMKEASVGSDLFHASDENVNQTYNMEVNKDIEYLNIEILDEYDDVPQAWAQRSQALNVWDL